MIRRLFLLLPAAFPALSAEALKVSARFEGKEIPVRVESALPKGAIVTIRVEREVGVVQPKYLPVLTLRQRVSEDGSLEARCVRGDEFGIPGRYRVVASYDPACQYPEAAAKVSTPPEPGHCLLEQGLTRKPYLEAVLREQAFLEKSYADACAFLVRLGEIQDLLKQDQAAGIKAWLEWRPQARKAQEEVTARAQELSRSFFPETANGCAAKKLHVVLEWETMSLRNINTEGAAVKTGPFKGQTRIPVTELDLWKALLLREAVLYRLSVLNNLAGESVKDPEKRQRATWEEVLALADQGLASPWKEKIADLAQSLRAWWDSGADVDRDALKAKFIALDQAARAGTAP